MTRSENIQRRRDRITAYHESGHAVMAVLNRIPLYDASIRTHDSDASSGRTRLDRSGVISNRFAGGNPLRDREYRQVMCSACFSMAGEIAQRRFAPKARRIDHSWSDMENVSRLLKGVGLAGAKLRAVAKAAAVRTDQLIEANWASVEAVANALLDKNSLTGAQVRRIVKDTAAKPSALAV